MDEAKRQLCCQDCGLPYAGEHWVEAVVAHDVWAAISPTGDESGILCINCMAKALSAKGLRDVPVMLTAGPFVASQPVPASDDLVRRVQELVECAVKGDNPAAVARAIIPIIQADERAG